MTGDNFRDWRQSLGWTQERTAAEFNRSRATIIAWESGRKDVPAEVGEVCRWKKRLWMQRLEFGPVTLVWTSGPLWLDAYSPCQVPTIELHACRNNQQAIEIAADKMAEGFHGPFVTAHSSEGSSDLIDVFDATEFRAAIQCYSAERI